MRFEAPIFHFRRRAARHRLAAAATGSRLFTGYASGFDAVERPSYQHDGILRISGWVGTPSDTWPLDTHRRDPGRDIRNVAAPHDSGGQGGASFAGHDGRLSRYAGPRPMVNRRSPFRLEARATFSSQD